jgi:tetratricopeptide (TPR) repeat protein
VRFRWLHRRAAYLAAAADDLPAAIDHALAAKRLALAARLIRQVAPTYRDGGRWQALYDWTADLPRLVLERYPDLLVISAEAEFERSPAERPTERVLSLISWVVAHCPADSEEQVVGRLLSVRVMQRQGRYEAVASACRGLIEQLAGGHARLLAEALLRGGMAETRLGNLEVGKQWFERAATLFSALNASGREASAREALALACMHLGDDDGGVGHLRWVEAQRRGAGSGPAHRRTLNSLGCALRQVGELDEAERVLRDALASNAMSESPVLEAALRLSLAEVARDRGDLVTAKDLCALGISAATTLGVSRLVRVGTDLKSHVLLLSGDLNGAEALSKQAMAEAESAGARHELALYRLTYAAILLERWDFAKARTVVEDAIEQLRISNARRDLARALLLRAKVAFARREKRATGAAVRELLAHLAVLGDCRFLAPEAGRAIPVIEFVLASGIGGAQLCALRDLALGFASRQIRDGAETAQRPPDEQRPAPSLDRAPEGPRSQPESAPSAPDNDVRIEAWALGDSRVRYLKKCVDEARLQAPKCRELFFYLLCHPGWHRREKVAALLWPDAAESQARSSFHTNAHRVRRALFHDVLEERGGRYRLNPQLQRWFDVEEFARLCAKLYDGDSAGEAVHLARQAAALYGGSFLEDLSPDWADGLRAQLAELADRVAEFLERQGGASEAVAGALAAARRHDRASTNRPHLRLVGAAG